MAQNVHVVKWRWELFWDYQGEFEEVIRKSPTLYSTKEAAKAEAIFECATIQDWPDCVGHTLYRIIREMI